MLMFAACPTVLLALYILLHGEYATPGTPLNCLIIQSRSDGLGIFGDSVSIMLAARRVGEASVPRGAPILDLMALSRLAGMSCFCLLLQQHCDSWNDFEV